MLKNKLKIPDKTRKPFPDRLGSLVAGFDSRDGENGGSGAALEFGEELETIQPNGFGSDREFEEPDDGVEEECAQDEDPAGGVGGGEPDLRARQKPNTREGSGPVSVLEVIAADEKRSDVEHEISREEINLEKLQRIASMGLPDEGGLRATTWKLLLGYLPPSRKLWEKELSENRLKYAKLKEDLLISPSEFARRKNLNSGPCETEVGSDVDGPLRRHQIAQEDHPLSLGKASVWNQYFENTEVAEQIDRDLQRTHPDMKFFSGETAISRRHREAMRNILLLFAKLNPAIRYVQGMNEVLAPIYYVFSTDPNEQNAANAEADSFSCFVRLLGDSVDHFCQQLDNSSVGILSTISRLSELLKTNDEELWRHLEFTTRVEPQFYAFRWITLLLTQEFSFQSILRIWDSLLGNPFGVQAFPLCCVELRAFRFHYASCWQLNIHSDIALMDMLLRVCCAMLLCVKSKLLRGDFIANLKLLQHYPDINIEHLLQVAMDLTPDTSSYRLSL